MLYSSASGSSCRQGFLQAVSLPAGTPDAVEANFADSGCHGGSSAFAL